MKIKRLNNVLTLSLFVLALFFPLMARSQQTQEIISQQDWITRQQQKRMEDNRLLRAKEAANKEKNRKTKEIEDKISVVAPEECFPLKKISLVAADSISKQQQKKLTTPFIGRCMGQKVVLEIVAAIKAEYEAQGYVIARISLIKDDLKNGELELKISEKKIDEIIIGENGFTDKMQKFTAFGNIEGTTLNIHDIDQGIFQINRLASNSAKADIQHNTADDGAKIYIENERQFPARASVAYDSLGNDYTGIYRTTFSGAMDNVLSLNDAINLSYTANLNNDRDIKDNKAFSADFSIPFGYNTFSYDYSRSEFMHLDSVGNFSGYTDTSDYTLDRVLFLKNSWRISGNISLTTKSAASYLNYHKIALSARRLTIGNIEFEISNDFENGTSIYLKPTYSHGLKLLNAKKDEDNLSTQGPKAQFQRFKFYATVSKKMTIPKTDVPVLLATEMDSQISNDVLFGSEQFSVGGYYSVRGFRDSYLVGDTGYYLRNSANFNVGSLVLPFINKKDLGPLSHLNKFKIEPFYDYGHIKNKFNSSSGRLAGTGIKTIFDSNYFSASLTYSVATNRSQMLPSNKKENKLIYFELTLSCC